METEKIVAFAGHRYGNDNIQLKPELEKVIENLIKKGYKIFYCGGKGVFDALSVSIVYSMKEKYDGIKMYLILSSYHHDSEKWQLPEIYDGSIYPELEEVYLKARITKRNEWIVDNCDVLVCHITTTRQSGAYQMLKYARKKNKSIIYVNC